MSIKVFPYGVLEVTIPASAKLSAFSKSSAKIYKKALYPNQAPSTTLFKVLAADEKYASAAVSAATTFVIEAGASEVLVNYGTDATVVERRAYQDQPAPVALNATGALTAAAVASGIVTSTTAAAVTGTLPTGTVLDAAFNMDIGESIDFSVIATGANAFTVAVDTGVTAVGTLVVATVTSGLFRLRKTAAETYIIYRLS